MSPVSYSCAGHDKMCCANKQISFQRLIMSALTFSPYCDWGKGPRYRLDLHSGAQSIVT